MAQTLPRREYDDFTVLVEKRSNGGYPVSVLCGPAGLVHTYCALNPDDAWLQEAREHLASGEADEPFLASLGCTLFEHIFTGEAIGCLRTALAGARGKNYGLRVRLSLQAPELATLPWEFLYDPAEDYFLGQSAETPLSRYVASTAAPRIAADGRALRVLVAVSSPKGVPQLNVAREQAMLEDAVRMLTSQGAIELEFCEHAAPGDIRRALHRVRPHVFHFTGHGYGGEDSLIFLENEDGLAYAVESEAFAELLAGSESTRLLVLNVRDSANQRRQKLEGSFPLLMRLGPDVLKPPLRSVVALPGAMSERATRVFMRDFYHDLARGFNVDAALADARHSMALGGAGAQWGRPILFM